MFGLSVTQRLTWLVGLPLLIIILLVSVSLWAFTQINQGVGRIYDDRVIPLSQLKAVSDAYTDTVNSINKADNGLMIPSDAVIQMRESQLEIKKQWQTYIRGKLNAEEQKLVRSTADLFGDADALIEEAINVLMSMGNDLQFDEDGDTLITDYNGDLYEYIDPITDAIASLMKIQLTIAKTERGQAQSIYDTVFLVFIIAAVLSLILMGASGFFVTKSINDPLNILRTGIYDVEKDKDLTLEVKLKQEDEIGRVAHSFNKMLKEFSTIMINVHKSSDHVKKSADELAEITKKTQSDAEIQSRDSISVAEASLQMSTAIDSVNENAEQARMAAKDAMNAVNNGKAVVDNTHDSVTRLEGHVSEAMSMIERVQRDSNAISSVLEVIRGISEQTNLLALNAAIEAARAGDQGRGFAVVADEVRALAVRTQESTQEIQSMINRLHEGITSAVNTIAEGKSEMNTTVEQTKLTNQSLETIATAVQLITQMSEQIAGAIEQQKTVSNEISINITRIAEVSKNAKLQVEGVQSSTNSLLETAENLSNWVSQFKFHRQK